MRQRKVYSLLRLLNAEEQQTFSDFLASPLFDPSETMQRFFTCWREKILNGVEDDQELNPALFLEGTGLIPSRIDKYCSALYKKVLDYLAWSQTMKDSTSMLNYTAEALEQREAPRKEWQTQRDRLAKEIETLGESSEKSLQQLHFKWKETEVRIQFRETQSIWNEDFQALHQAVDRYFILQKLKLQCAAANARLIYNQVQPLNNDLSLAKIPDFTLEEAQAKLDALSFSYWLTLSLYNSKDGTEEFNKLFVHLQNAAQKIADDERREIFNYALNYCLRRSNKGEVAYQINAASLYRELLDNGILLEQGKLAPQVLKNIVAIHCVIGHLDWVGQFLDGFQFRLEGDFAADNIAYNRAVLAFYRKDRSAIGLLKEVISLLKEDVFYQLDARIYLLKAYFEHFNDLDADELDDMDKIFDSFRIFIDRNQFVSRMHKQGYRNFLLAFRKFLKILEANPRFPHQGRLQKLYQRILEVDYMANKGWLLEKIKAHLKASGSASPNATKA